VPRHHTLPTVSTTGLHRDGRPEAGTELRRDLVQEAYLPYRGARRSRRRATAWARDALRGDVFTICRSAAGAVPSKLSAGAQHSRPAVVSSRLRATDEGSGGCPSRLALASGVVRPLSGVPLKSPARRSGETTRAAARGRAQLATTRQPRNTQIADASSARIGTAAPITPTAANTRPTTPITPETAPAAARRYKRRSRTRRGV
jgi:hypothetical protein